MATKDTVSHKVTLFKDVVHHDGKTTSTTEHRTLRNSPVRYLTTSSASQTSVIGDVVLVCENGEVITLSGETLGIRWSSPSKSAVQDASTSPVDKLHIDFVTSGSLADFSEGMFKNHPEVYTAMPKTVTTDPTILVLVSRSVSQGQESRHLLVLAVSPSDSANEAQRLIPLDVAPIPATEDSVAGQVGSYEFEAQSGTLLQLLRGSLVVYDLSGAVPKLKSVIQMGEAVTFAKLSRPFVLSSSLESLGLYNYQYRSVHASTPLDLSDLPAENREAHSCQIISYLRSQDLALALIDNVLVCIHVEPPKSNGRSRKAGMLIDSIGRGTFVEMPPKRAKLDHPSSEFSRTVPGTMTESYLAQFHSDVEELDKLLSNNQVAEWEEGMRSKLGMRQKRPSDGPSGFKATGNEQQGDDDMAPEWDWYLEPSAYPPVDRRWIVYAISRVFTSEVVGGEQPRLGLRLMIGGSQVTTYLALAGHLALSNVKSAFRDELEAQPVDGRTLAGDVISSLVETDETMTLLLNYLRATKLGEVEVLLAIRELMLSMGLISDATKKATTKLIAEEAHKDKNEDEASPAGQNRDEMELDDLERKIEATENYLGDESSTRSRGLTLAFTKLWRLPTRTTVKALRETLSMGEMLSLVHLLRVELVQGAWTSLYVDLTSFDADDEGTSEPPPDGVITLISDLLGRCLDAVGVGGWLLNDAAATADAAADVEADGKTDAQAGQANDFLSALKLEVTAALEGIEEAVFLGGVVGESVRYGVAVQKGVVGKQSWNTNKPVSIMSEGIEESRMLPLGLKVKALPSRDKVVSGGEVIQRNLRETGHLISQKVEAYSLEKLVV